MIETTTSTGALTILAGFNYAMNLTDFLYRSGIWLIPILWIIVSSWISPMAKGNKTNQTSVHEISLNLMFYRLSSALFVIILAFKPMIWMEGKDIQNVAGETATEIMAREKVGLEDKIKMPLIPAMGIISFNAVSSSMIKLLPQKQELFAIKHVVSTAKIEDPKLAYEINAFYTYCYVPAMRRYYSGDQELNSPNWVGHGTMLRYYSDLSPALIKITKDYGLEVKAGMGPSCQGWWRGGENGAGNDRSGLLDRLYEHIISKQSTLDYFEDHGITVAQNIISIPTSMGKAVLGGDDAFNSSDLLAAGGFKGALVKRALESHKVQAHGSDKSMMQKVIDGLQGAVGTVGVGMFSIIVNMAIEPVKAILPVLQGILLMVIIMITPLAFVLSGYSLAMIITILGYQFALISLSFIWALCAFFEGLTLDLLYPDQAGFVGEVLQGTQKDILWSLLTAIMYIGFPLLWFRLLMEWGLPRLEGFEKLNNQSVESIKSGAESITRIH